jgi:hypothetical protein
MGGSVHEPGKRPGTQDSRAPGAPVQQAVGKQTLVGQADPSATHAAAAQGIATPSSALPHMDAIQRSFGRHDISGVQAHTGSDAAASAGAMGARAYATGDHVVLGRGTDLHTVAHEAAHVVQQRAGVHLKGGVGEAGDPYEQHADAVADLVVQGKSAEGLLDTHAPAGGAAKSAPPGAVQHKLEYATHHAIAPDAAKNAVKADQAGYQHDAEQFELKLGTGLHKNAQAQAGADAMLTRMRAAMTRAGFDEATQHKAFGAADAAKASPDLGAVLTRDVGEALASGNLREKMGMVYQARGKISEALDRLRGDAGAQDMIGDELKTPAMGNAIAAEKAKQNPVSYAILARRPSVTDQRRNRGDGRAEITENQLSDDGVPLSAREQAAAQPGPGGRAFVPGQQVYAIPPDIRKREQDNLRRVAAGLSGSTDMYFHIAKHLNMPEGERRQLRLASLGQMLANRDHSYHEIMHEAKTQGGLADYPDELPIGYTTLAPLSHDDILTTAGVADFPGDAQIKAISGPMATSAAITAAAPPSASSKTYPAVLAQLRAYEGNPSKAKLQTLIAAITKWLKDEKPGRLSTAATTAKYNARAPHLQQVLQKAQYILAMWDGLAAKAAGTREGAAKGAVETSPEFMKRVGDLDGDHDDWYSPAFRAKSSDLALDTSAIAIPAGPADEARLGITEPLNHNLKSETANSVGESRWELEAINGGDGRNVPDIEETAPGMMRNLKKRNNQASARDKESLKKNPDDFADLDAADIQALQPNAPLGGVLKRFEGKPVPTELHAINAYTQAGFYEMMNHVLSKRGNKAYMATPAGQAWWASVPDQTKQLISLAISGVRKMKPFTGDVYRGENLVRGVGAVLGQPKAAREAHWKSKIPTTKRYDQFVSTSKQAHSSYIVKQGKYTAEHITKTKTGVDISALGGKLDEREVLFAPGTTFKVTNVEDRFDPTRTRPADRYGSAAGEADPLTGTELGRIKVTFEEA